VIIVTILLAAAAGVFYGAGYSRLPWSSEICGYGGMLCQHPSWLGVAAVLSLMWALFLRVDRL
jgi:hypothetical protein